MRWLCLSTSCFSIITSHKTKAEQALKGRKRAALFHCKKTLKGWVSVCREMGLNIPFYWKKASVGIDTVAAIQKNQAELSNRLLDRWYFSVLEIIISVMLCLICPTLPPRHVKPAVTARQSASICQTSVISAQLKFTLSTMNLKHHQILLLEIVVIVYIKSLSKRGALLILISIFISLNIW